MTVAMGFISDVQPPTMHHDEWESESSERTGGATCVVQSRCVEHGAKRWIEEEGDSAMVSRKYVED
jgi:hypothetical protein